jgi:hypothetical protein
LSSGNYFFRSLGIDLALGVGGYQEEELLKYIENPLEDHLLHYYFEAQNRRPALLMGAFDRIC